MRTIMLVLLAISYIMADSYFRFEGNLTDSSGKLHIETYAPVKYVPGIKGQAIDKMNVEFMVAIKNSYGVLFPPRPLLAVSFWVKRSSTGTIRLPQLDDLGMLIEFEGNNVVFTSMEIPKWRTHTAIQENEWNHIVVSDYIYLNGERVFQPEEGWNKLNYPIAVSVPIDELRIFDNTVNESKALALYSMDLPTKSVATVRPVRIAPRKITQEVDLQGRIVKAVKKRHSLKTVITIKH